MTDDDPLPEAQRGPGARVTVYRKLLEALVCPATGATLHYDAERLELVSRAAALAYPIRDGIPIMLVSEARRLTD